MSIKKVWALLLSAVLLMGSTLGLAETLTGVGEGFGGPIEAEVTVEDGKITALTLKGEKETAGIGDEAIKTLTEAILAQGSLEGVDTVTNATWTSKGVFAAINAAMGIETEEAAAATAESVSASALSHGIGIASTPRLGPGKDAEGVGVYSFNEVVAYVIVDSEQRIVDLEVDVVEIITPNHDASNEEDNFMAGWPGQEYNNDADGDGVVEEKLTETEEIFTNEVEQWTSKRQKGSAYKMTSGTWEQEMDIFENFFIGKTVEEIYAWNEKFCSPVNGRPVSAASTREEDIAVYNALTDEEKESLDAITGATMSLTDPHGDLLAAIANAVENVTPMEADITHIAKTGLGIDVVPRLGPGSDDQGVPVYSFNLSMAGVSYDENGAIVDLTVDVLEIITPNHDSEHDNRFTGWPGQSYNADEDADGVVDAVWEQTEESFMEQIATYRTKRALGNSYKMNAGTWEQEMDAYEALIVGMTTEEVTEWFAACFSDVNGRSLRATSEKEGDAEKYAAMTDEQKAELDAATCATMSLRDAHGDIITAIENAFAAAKTVDITVE